MNQIWIVVLVVAALFFLTRVRRKRRRSALRTPTSTLRIQGHQINAYLHPRMGAGCLFDSGMQYGRGFRRKEGPVLPHDENCRCEAVPFSFSSSEVFNGALRGVVTARSSIPGLPLQAGRLLIDRLKALEGQPLPPQAEAYVESAYPPDLPEAWREDVQAFLLERYRFLREREESPTNPAPPPAPPAEAAGPQAGSTAKKAP